MESMKSMVFMVFYGSILILHSVAWLILIFTMEIHGINDINSFAWLSLVFTQFCMVYIDFT